MPPIRTALLPEQNTGHVCFAQDRTCLLGVDSEEIHRMFEKDVLPVIGDLFVMDVRKGHIMLVIDKLLARAFLI
ncbi:MAG: hypothetical protein LBF16_13150 [Pseudomonadales bacterium]|jgi:hypothetical protein|nr:hypothetical protein [Pseudomonadales bacterium]